MVTVKLNVQVLLVLLPCYLHNFDHSIYTVMHSQVLLVNLVHLNLFVKNGRQYVYIIHS